MKNGLHIQNSPERLQSFMKVQQIWCCKDQLVSTVKDDLRWKKKNYFSWAHAYFEIIIKRQLKHCVRKVEDTAAHPANMLISFPEGQWKPSRGH